MQLSVRMSRDVLGKDGVSDARMRELIYFSYQYGEKRALARALEDVLRGAEWRRVAACMVTPGTPREETEGRLRRLREDLEDVEQAVVEACEGVLSEEMMLAYVTHPVERPPIETFFYLPPMAARSRAVCLSCGVGTGRRS